MRIDHGLLPGHVLQRTPRGARAAITGTCDAAGRAPVTATVRSRSKVLIRARRIGVASEGRFHAVLAGLPTGGPYRVELACAGERIAVEDVFVGDLWLMAGQSNMEGVGSMAGAPEPHPLVRNFTMDRRWELARDPLHQLYASPDPVHWERCDLSAARKRPFTRREADAYRLKQPKGVGVGVHVGIELHRRSGVPQGLIATAHGGTGMVEWDPALRDRGGESLYGSMWLSLQAVGQPIAGVLWYQGCTDADPQWLDGYTARMQALVAALRRDLGQPRLPWIMVQIARVVNDTTRAEHWNGLQEQQRRLPASIPHLVVVPAVDLELDDGIHIGSGPQGHPLLARRMAGQAARLAWRDRRERPAIQPLSARLIEPAGDHDCCIEVSFRDVVGGLESDGPARGFAVLDPAGQPQAMIHKTVLRGDRAVLYTNRRVMGPVSVSYGHGADPVCTIRDRRGMGLPAFRAFPVQPVAGIGDWFLRWRVTPVLAGEDIGVLPRPSPDDPQLDDRTFPPLFANMWPAWKGNSGHGAFHGWVEAPEAMQVEVRTGYDGPFRMWIGESEVHTNLGGSNPARPDDYRFRLRLARGRHPVTVLMATNQGRAWGFYLRMRRLDGGAALPEPWT